MSAWLALTHGTQYKGQSEELHRIHLNLPLFALMYINVCACYPQRSEEDTASLELE